MTSATRIVVILSAIATIGLVACLTIEKSADKAKSKDQASNACSGMDSRRGDCEDMVGCYWDHGTGSCLSRADTVAH